MLSCCCVISPCSEVRLADGAVRPSCLNHQRRYPAAARSVDQPPVIRVVSIRDLVLTGGRNATDACVNVWYMGGAPETVPASPACTLGLESTSASLVYSLSFLPHVQCVVDTRSNGDIHFWDLTRAMQSIRDPSAAHDRAACSQADEAAFSTTSASVPALTRSTKWPAAYLCVPQVWCGSCDLLVTFCRLPAQPSQASGSYTAELSSWTVTRTRLSVPAIVADRPEVPQLLKDKVAARARITMAKAATEVQSAMERQLVRVAKNAEGPQATHAKGARSYAARGVLEFTWKPPDRAALKGLTSLATSGWRPRASGNLDLVLFVSEVDNLSLDRVGADVWKAPSGTLNFLHAYRARRFWHPPAAQDQQETIQRWRERGLRCGRTVAAAGSHQWSAAPLEGGVALSDVVRGSRGALGAGIVSSGGGSVSRIEWSARGSLGEVLEEAKRLKVLEAHGQSILLPLPKPLDMGYKSTSADAPVVFSVLHGAGVLPYKQCVDDFVARAKKLAIDRKAPLKIAPARAQFDDAVAASGAGASSVGAVSEGLSRLGMAPDAQELLTDHLLGLGYPEAALARAVSERLASAGAVTTPAALRDLIGAAPAGLALVESLAEGRGEAARHDWGGDAVSEGTVVRTLARCGVPLCTANKKALLEVLKPALRGSVYSASDLLRLLFGPDEVARALAGRSQELQQALGRLDPAGRGVAEVSGLVAALRCACADRLTARLASLHHDARAAGKDLVHYGPLLEALAACRSAGGVLELLARSAPQGAVVRLLALFCGGMLVPPAGDEGAWLLPHEDFISPYGWAGVPGVRGATHSPRLFGYEAISHADLGVVARSIAGVVLSDESLSVLAAHLDTVEGAGPAGVTSAKAFLRKLHAGRAGLVQKAIQVLAGAGDAEQDRQLSLTEALGATAALPPFLARARELFPELERLPELGARAWPLVAEAHGAAGQGGAVDVRGLSEAVAHAVCRGADGRQGSLRSAAELVYGAREAVLGGCQEADGPGFGTLPIEAFLAAIARVRVILSDPERSALGEFADLRGDGLVPYRAAVRRLGLLLGRHAGVGTAPAQDQDSDQDGLPPPAGVSDLWELVAASLRDRALDLRRDVFLQPAGAPSDGSTVEVTRRLFLDAIDRLGISIGARQPGDGDSGSGPPGRSDRSPRLLHRPLGASDLTLATGRDLAGAAFRELDTGRRGSVTLADVERKVHQGAAALSQREAAARTAADWALAPGQGPAPSRGAAAVARALSPHGRGAPPDGRGAPPDGHGQASPGLTAAASRHIPAGLLPRLQSGGPGLAATLVALAADFEAQQLTPFEAFACLDASRTGLLYEDRFCLALRLASPAVSLQQAREVFQLMRSLPSDGRASDEAVDLFQFEQVFPLKSGSLQGRGLWLSSIVGRVARHLGSRGMTPEALFKEVDAAGRGAVTQADMVRAAADLRLGISPEEARALHAAAVERCSAAPPAGETPPRDATATYRGLVAVLRPALEREHSGTPGSETVGTSMRRAGSGPPRRAEVAILAEGASGADVVRAVSQHLHRSDPTLVHVFRRFAAGGRLPRAALPELLAHLGLRLDPAQQSMLWRELGADAAAAVEERAWQQLFRVSTAIGWDSVFSRLEVACTVRGAPLESFLEDLAGSETATWLSEAAARKIFAKLGLVASEQEIFSWLKAVAQPAPSGFGSRVPIAHAAAVTASRAYGGRMLAARRLQDRLRSQGVSASQALAVLLRGRGRDASGMPSASQSPHHGPAGASAAAGSVLQDASRATLTRRDVVGGLCSMGLATSEADLEQLLDMLDPRRLDRIAADAFLRAAAPDQAAARAELARRGATVHDGTPTVAQVRAAVAGAGLFADGTEPTEADLLILALTSGSATEARRWWLDPSPAEGQAAGGQRSTIRALRQGHGAGTRATGPRKQAEASQTGVKLRAEVLLRRLLQSVSWDVAVLSSVLPPSPPLLSLRQLNAALSPLGVHLEPEDADVLRRAFPDQPPFNADGFASVQGLLDAAQRFRASEDAAGVRGTPGAPAGGACSSVPAERLEAVLRAPPLSFSAEDAHALVSAHAVGGGVDVARLLRDMAQRRLGLGGFFLASKEAFEYLDHDQLGLLDFVHFRDRMLQVMSGSLPRRGAAAPQRPAAAPGRPGHAPSDDVCEASPLDPDQRESCSGACESLFRALACDSLGLRRARGIPYGRFEVFWRSGPGGLVPAAEVAGAGRQWGAVCDFWAAELQGMVVARGQDLASLAAARTGKGLPGQVPALELAELVTQLLAMRFAPLLLSPDREKPLTDKSKFTPTLTASVHAHDLTCPLMLALQRHAERLVQCAIQGPIDMSRPLGSSDDAAMHWSVSGPRFAEYCKSAASATPKMLLVGASSPLDADLGRRCLAEANVFCYAFACAQALAGAVASLRAQTLLGRRAAAAVGRCFAWRLRELHALVADMLMAALRHVSERVLRSRLGAQGCAAGALGAPGAADARRDISMHLNSLQHFRLEDLAIEFESLPDDRPTEFGSSLGEEFPRKTYCATHPQVCWVAVEAVEPAPPGSPLHHKVHGSVKFSGPPRPVVFRLSGRARSVDTSAGVEIAEVLEGPPEFRRASEERWQLRRPLPPAEGGVGRLVSGLRPGDSLLLQGSGMLSMAVELVPKAWVSKATVVEAALCVYLSGRSAECFAGLLGEQELAARQALGKARVSHFLGWWSQGDYALAKEPGTSEGWACLHDVVDSAGGLGQHWLNGGMLLFRLLCRQILGLMMLLHKHGFVARHLRLRDFLLSSDGRSLRLHSLRFASPMGTSLVTLPSLCGSGQEPLAPEFFSRGAARATREEAVDSWVFGCLAFHLFFGEQAPRFQHQLAQFLAAHPGVPQPRPGQLRLPRDLPAHFCYSPLAAVPPRHRSALRAAVEERCRAHVGPPRAEAPPGTLLTALGSHSALAPWPPFVEPAPPAAPAGGDDGAPWSETVVLPTSQALDLVFGCLQVDRLRRPPVEQLLAAAEFDLGVDFGLSLMAQSAQLDAFSRGWIRGASAPRGARLEHVLRVACAYLFAEPGRDWLTEAQHQEVCRALHEVEGLLLAQAPFPGPDALKVHVHLCRYVNFLCMRTKHRHPELLRRFCEMLSAVLDSLTVKGSTLSAVIDDIIDLLVCGICGRELPLGTPARHRTCFFLRPANWKPGAGMCDVVDEMWRHHGQELFHFGTETYLAFEKLHSRLLSESATEDAVSVMAGSRVHPLQPAIRRRKVRGPGYLRALAECADTHYRYALGGSPVGQRFAVRHSRKVVCSGDLEKVLALVDLRVPPAYVALLGCPDECVLEEVVPFFEEAGGALLPPGEHCHAGLDCPACGALRPHHSARGVQLLAALAAVPGVGLEVQRSAVRVLIDIASAYGQPPQRQALGHLLGVLQSRGPSDDPVARLVPPYVRKLLMEVLQYPTPALSHAICCFPATFGLLGLGRADVVQPASMGEVEALAREWVRRARESARLAHAGRPNWRRAAPLLAWARHLARLDQVAALTSAVDALLEVYREAFIHAEMPHLPGPSPSGAPAPDAWAQGPGREFQGAGDQHADADRSGPFRYMVEFLGLVEALFLRFGWAPVRKAVERFVSELQDSQLAETSWYFQVLSLFGILTAHRVPWVQLPGPQAERLRLQSLGIHDAKAGPQDCPGSWALARWHGELSQMGMGSALSKALHSTFAPSRVLMRRPVWTVTLAALLRTIWQNVIGIPHAEPAKRTEVPEPDAGKLVRDLVQQGCLEFLVDCSAGGEAGVGEGAQPAARHDQLVVMRQHCGALLGDAVHRGRHHRPLVQTLVRLVSRDFAASVAEQLRSPSRGTRDAGVRLLRALVELRSEDADGALLHTDVEDLLRAGLAEAACAAPGPEELPPDPLLDHPLALHRVQVGELVGGARAAHAPAPAEAEPGLPAEPAPREAAWRPARSSSVPSGQGRGRALQTEVVVPLRRSASRGRGRGRL
ncbi:unnamed protein product [Prorocentrum cordatum]|uniref:Protein kinase domain-containing protein n=1 Tax=Prorocentrum cordatum TaxID=2364126 RepID=A0ABN9WIX4_9DINO|nr:unnamed protein product [Polarella glacialis]